MSSTAWERKTEQTAGSRRMDLAVVVGIAALCALGHIATNGRYGFHRDELQFLSDARHLDWGFVSYPPMTPFLEHIGLSLFGLSLVGLRMFSVIAQALVIVISGLMARDLGGGRLAQVTTSLCVALSPLPLFEATEFQYTSFGFLWFALIAWFTIKLLKTEDPRWWLGIGAAVGLGLLTKYSIVFFIAGILAGVVLTPARRHLRSGWFWAGIATALLIFLPNLLWLVHHNFISYDFLKSIHQRDVGQGRADGFLLGQFIANANLVAVPVWIAGLIAYFRDRRYRMLGWMYVVPVLMFWVGKGRFYYTAEAYPMLLAMGCVVAERWLRPMPRLRRVSIESAFFVGIFAVGAYASARLVPLAASGPLRDYALSKNNDLREEIGWDDLVRTVASIRDSLPPDQQAHLGITVGNYGEQGAIEILGPAYHLPPPISTTNSAWLRGYPTPPPTTIIALGISAENANQIFTGCRLAGHNGNSLGIQNEESQYHPDIFVCGPPRKPWSEVWKEHKDFG
ncbi:glycosyltransferase family 39 protein [Acidobacteria bacterium AB60]|nr:glycosyltransferase family 39 protein [Acidobacteria bacterium AB60]